MKLALLAFVTNMKACTELKFKILTLQYCEAMFYLLANLVKIHVITSKTNSVLNYFAFQVAKFFSSF